MTSFVVKETNRPVIKRAFSPGIGAGGCWRSAIGICSWTYSAVFLALWATVSIASDRWWFATALIFAPHWLWALPLVVLIPAAAIFRRRLLFLLFGILVLAGGPATGFCIPWSRWQAADPGLFRVRVLTCNVHRGELQTDQLGLLIAETMPDIVALQDWTDSHEKHVFWQQEWHIRRVNDICLASRFPITNAHDIAGEESVDRGALIGCELETPIGQLHLLNLHLASPREGLERLIDREGIAELQANSEQRTRQSERAREWASRMTRPLLVAGDFNTPTDSSIYREYWSDFTNAFSRAGFGWGHTYFTHKTSIRIDHLLAGPGWRCHRSWVCPDVGSAHRPLIADWEWVDYPQ